MPVGQLPLSFSLHATTIAHRNHMYRCTVEFLGSIDFPSSGSKLIFMIFSEILVQLW